MLTLDSLTAATRAALVGAAHAHTFDALAFDTRLLLPGELFVAIRSERGDGHDYLNDAVAKGATGLLVHQPIEPIAGVTVLRVADTQQALRDWARHALRTSGVEVVAVTGSTGKTSTKEAIAHVLAARQPVFRNPGNWNGRFGMPFALSHRVPDQRLAVLELASDSHGEIAELAEMVQPAVAVVTTVQPAHLDIFGTLERIAEEKAALVQAVVPSGITFLHGDDPRVRAMASLSAAPSFCFGTDAGDDLRASAVSFSASGTAFILTIAPRLAEAVGHPPGEWPIRTPLLGRPALIAALAATAVGLHYGLPIGEISERLRTLPRVPGRLNPLVGPRGSLILDDSYNASPMALEAALDLLAALPATRRIALLGEMRELGSERVAAHERAGQRAAAVVDRLVTRGEGASLMAHAARMAGLDAAQIAITHTVEDAVRAVGPLDDGEVLLVKGSAAARMEQVVARLLEEPTRELVRQDAAWRQISTRPQERPTWIEVDLEAIAHNVRHLRQIAAPAQVMAVVKADGYGHGAIPVARTALHNGARWLGVACLPEGQALREAGITAPILLLGYTPPWQARGALQLDLTVTIFSMDCAEALSRAAEALGRQARAHVKVDTGMHRLGVAPDDLLPFVRAVRALPGIEIEGLFTHFSVADSADPPLRDHTRRQLSTFLMLRDVLAADGLLPPILHAANSAGTLVWADSRLDLVRPGIAIYGLAPSADVPLPADFRPALTWKTEVAQVRTLGPDEPISYGATYRTCGVERIATIPVGYADGFRRAPTTWGEVLVRGQRASLVGRVCMDQAMIGVSHIPDVRAGDEVVLIGSQGDDTISAEEVAARLGTIPYEVVSAILPRVTRL